MRKEVRKFQLNKFFIFTPVENRLKKEKKDAKTLIYKIGWKSKESILYNTINDCN